MRTVLIQDLENSAIKEYILKGDDAFHLSKVVRVKINQEIQITNGRGMKIRSQVKTISKNEVLLSILETFETKRPHNFSLLCGKPKKPTCEEIIRLGVELGLVHLFFWDSEFSQESIFSEDRLQQIVKNTMEQSNNLWLPKIHFIKNLSFALSPEQQQLVHSSQSFIFHNDPQSKPPAITSLLNELKLHDQTLLVVGPEGGLSIKDLEELKNVQPQSEFVSLPSPILTTPTAIASSVGYLFAKASKA